MSNDKLAEALRHRIHNLRLQADISASNGDNAGSVTRRIVAEALERDLQVHAAEAAQPLPQMTDAEHAEIQAKYGTAQAAEPVAWRVANHPQGPFDFRSRKPIGWAVMEPLYTHPQPAQDAKDAARYRHMIETSPFMCFGASEYHKKSDLDEAIDNSIAAMAKESGR